MTTHPESDMGGRIVRPYTMTGGRSGVGLPNIALEALVAVTPAGMRMRGGSAGRPPKSSLSAAKRSPSSNWRPYSRFPWAWSGFSPSISETRER